MIDPRVVQTVTKTMRMEPPTLPTAVEPARLGVREFSTPIEPASPSEASRFR